MDVATLLCALRGRILYMNTIRKKKLFFFKIVENYIGKRLVNTMYMPTDRPVAIQCEINELIEKIIVRTRE